MAMLVGTSSVSLKVNINRYSEETDSTDRRFFAIILEAGDDVLRSFTFHLSDWDLWFTGILGRINSSLQLLDLCMYLSLWNCTTLQPDDYYWQENTVLHDVFTITVAMVDKARYACVVILYALIAERLMVNIS